MNWFAFFWFVIAAACIVLEASTVGLVSIWFAVGALSAMLASILGGELWLQILLFLVMSGSLLALLRPVSKKYFTPKLIKTNVDALVGTTGMVLEAVDNDRETGRVKLSGMEWAARSTNSEKLPVNTRIRVDKVEGVKVFVSEAPVTVK